MIQNLSPRFDAAKGFQAIASFCAWNLIVSIIAGSACSAANEPLHHAQERVQAIYQNLQTATVRIRSGSDVSSGVIVSKSGLVLSVAHGLKPGTRVATVSFQNGEMCEAKCVLVDQQADVACLEMDVAAVRDFRWSIVPVPAVKVVVVGEVVVASGYPAREADGMQPVVRLGEIIEVDKAALKTSSPLTSGDSGGPLVNSLGELIGLHRQIGVGAASNGHIALSAIHRAMENTDQWKALAKQSRSDAVLMSGEMLPSSQIEQAARVSTVKIHIRDERGQSSVRILGTLLDGQHVATKLSEIYAYTALTCELASGTMIPASLSKSDRNLDLAILKLAHTDDNGESMRAATADFRNTTLNRGQIVFAATGPHGSVKAGILSRLKHEDASQPARFGATMQVADQTVRITAVSPNGSAVLAGLQAGDELRQVDASDVLSLQAVGELLAVREPGDWISIGFQRATTRFEVQTQLQHDPAQQFEKTEFLDGRSGQVSQRRSGFHNVLQHDIVIEPVACGGPLFDIYGKLIAINIARRARESTLAIPLDEVLKFAKED